MKGTGIIFAILALLLIGAVAYFTTRSTQVPVPSIPIPTIEVGKDVKSFTVVGKPFEFNPKEIQVKKGDMVKIEFKNELGFHDFTIEGFNVKTKQIQVGESDTIQFVADKTGEFKFFCSVPTHADKGMVGKLIVTE